MPFFDELARLLPAAKPVFTDLRHAGEDGSVFHYDVVRAQGGICSTAKPKPTKLLDLNGEAFSDVAESYAGANYVRGLTALRASIPNGGSVCGTGVE